jgi:N-acyl homoserine lactone hydrolase
VSVASTGQVQIRPDQEAPYWRPTAWWLLASRRWTGPRPINAYVIGHRDGLVLFDSGQDRASVTDPGYFPGGVTGVLYRRGAAPCRAGSAGASWLRELTPSFVNTFRRW